MEFGPLKVTFDRGIAVVTIDQEPLPLVGGEFIVGLLGLLPALEGASDLRVVVFRSADPDYFLMHGDVEFLAAAPVAEHATVTEPNIAAALFDRIHRARYLSIGIVDGAARGGGCEFLSALDLRIGSPRTVIGQPEVPMGILPGAGGTTRWPRLIGRAAALELLLTGRDVDAGEALRIGWLQQMHPSETVEARAIELARSIARMHPETIAAVKEVVDTSLGTSNDALVSESDALATLMSTGRHVEPMKRFLDAGGQTRVGEAGGIDALIRAMVGPVD